MYVITDRCTNCGLCVEVCPIGAIQAGDPIHVIDETCCDFEECRVVCPEDAIIESTMISGDGRSDDVEAPR